MSICCHYLLLLHFHQFAPVFDPMLKRVLVSQNLIKYSLLNVFFFCWMCPSFFTFRDLYLDESWSCVFWSIGGRKAFSSVKERISSDLQFTISLLLNEAVPVRWWTTVICSLQTLSVHKNCKLYSYYLGQVQSHVLLLLIQNKPGKSAETWSLKRFTNISSLMFFSFYISAHREM